MKYALFGTFQQRIKRFGSIIMHIAAYKLLRTVSYPGVRCIVFSDLLICPILIGHQVRLPVYKTFNQRTKLGGLITINQCRPDLSLALDCNQNTLLFGAFAALGRDTLLVTGFAAKVFFIQLYDTVQWRPAPRARFHQLANRMAHFPGGALSHSQPLAHEH